MFSEREQDQIAVFSQMIEFHLLWKDASEAWENLMWVTEGHIGQYFRLSSSSNSIVKRTA